MGTCHRPPVPRRAVDTHDRPYKEVTGTEDLYVLIDDDPEMEAVSDPGSRPSSAVASRP
ncbi:MAG: hypothetical protein Ct9H300mP12_15290 [Acidimicrobiales bacterium]|nr:MAG: hypothetical protein Ct9H300mP12_15290 [Acidimicrobiales bacterium]